MKWFGKDENLKTYPDWKYYGQTNVVGCIWLLFDMSVWICEERYGFSKYTFLSPDAEDRFS